MGPEDERQAAGGRDNVLDPEAFYFLRAHFRRWEVAAWRGLAEGIVRGDGKPREVRGVGERRTAATDYRNERSFRNAKQTESTQSKDTARLGLGVRPAF